MSSLTLAFDPSSSLSKGLYSLEDGQMQVMTMEPDLVKVSKSSLEQLEQGSVGISFPENEAIVGYGNGYYAVGFVARSQFYSYDHLKQLKYEKAVPKVLGMVGAIAQRKRLRSKFGLKLGILLPYCEYQDRLKLKTVLKEALSQFSFRHQSYQVELEFFECLPEGSGVLLRGGNRQNHSASKSLLVVMIGYRNVSYLLMERGKLTRGETEDLGFVWLINKVKEATSGLKATELIVPIIQGGRNVNKTPFKSLLKSQSDSLRKEELTEIVKAVQMAREQYKEILLNWLVSRQFPSVDEVILSGGTANYYRKELENFFSQQSYHWADSLENKVKKLVEPHQYDNQFRYRLTDIYGYYFYLQYLLRKHQSLSGGKLTKCEA